MFICDALQITAEMRSVVSVSKSLHQKTTRRGTDSVQNNSESFVELEAPLSILEEGLDIIQPF